MGTLKGYTQLDGSPAKGILPEGVHDMAAIGDETVLDKAIQEQLEGLYVSELSKTKARFKLEVSFMEGRSRMNPFLGVVCVWTNGGFSHGGGDEVVYLCPAKIEGSDGHPKTCGAPIDLKFVSKSVAVCAECGNPIKPKELTGQIVAKLTSQDWAKLMTQLFVRLQGDADIRMGFMSDGLRKAAVTEQGAQLHGDKLHAVRDRRHWVNYPLSSIIKDTSSGSSLYKRIRAFLEA